jgi:hypothetical protein
MLGIKNWQTTFAGIFGGVVAVGTMIGTYAEFLPPKYAAIALGIGTLSAALGNLASKQNSVHSTREEVTAATIEEVK